MFNKYSLQQFNVSFYIILHVIAQEKPQIRKKNLVYNVTMFKV